MILGDWYIEVVDGSYKVIERDGPYTYQALQIAKLEYESLYEKER